MSLPFSSEFTGAMSRERKASTSLPLSLSLSRVHSRDLFTAITAGWTRKSELQKRGKAIARNLGVHYAEERGGERRVEWGDFCI
jgi:hypothetical protein